MIQRPSPLVFLLLASIFVGAVAGRAEDTSADAAMVVVPELQTGFRFLYEQRFPEARQTFLGWEEQHPDDPFGHAAVAASYLFEEFYRQGVLTSDFFLDDEKFLRGINGKPDLARLIAFYSALDRTRASARARMRSNPKDPDALFSLTLASGMQADALSILERKQLESLKHIKEAETTAKQLLAQRPDAADAWLALGMAHYIIGSLRGPKRFVLRFDGIHGDRKLGMEELTRTASNGRYLKPFAKIMLALAARREKKDDLARNLLRELNEEFPSSPLFAIEYARVMSPLSPAQIRPWSDQ
jgi:tetratricopeptide (TPR) repeat protein